ncbi:true [Pyrenophora tritici-repentis]|nr:Cation efflux protein [Pyrenophora tritici-repentis]PZD40275.1 true [Pyrenophora tritici-repentis]
MASTYALPIVTTAHAHSHARSISQYTPEASSYANGALNASTPEKKHGHRHARSEMNGNGHSHGAVSSPYANNNTNAHEHTHGLERSTSSDSAYTLKPFLNARSKKTPVVDKYGFSPVSPIQESPAQTPHALSAATSSWLELPEALTAFLIPLPYLFASIAYPAGVRRMPKVPTTLSEAVAGAAPALETNKTLGDSPLLHSLVLSSATLLLVGIIAKVNSTLQPLDRRKEEKSNRANAPMRMASNVAGVLLPFYATLQLGGAKTALLLLVALGAGIGAMDQRPGKNTPWDDMRRTFRTRKTTCGALFLAMVADIATSGNLAGSLVGYAALLTTMLLAPPPLPTARWSIMTGTQSQGSYMGGVPSRASLPKPSSPLTNTSENQLLTIASGLVLTVTTFLYSLVASSPLSFSHHTLSFSSLSIASAVALVYFSLPTSLRSQKQVGLKLSGIFIFAFSFWEHYSAGHISIAFPWVCALLVGAVAFDTRSPVPHSHGHGHAGHKHSHGHDDHHLHGNHSRISAFLIARATPGSIVHSVLIERDSRRIAYFGVLNLGFMMVQFFYGFVSGSLGLLTDSIHMLFDCAGLAVGLAAAVMSKWRPNARFPYGYGKIDTLSGFANGVFLLLVSVEIIFDAFERLWEGHEIHRLNELLIVSVLGFLVNIVGLTAFGHAHHGHGHDHGHEGHDHGHSHDNENMQGIFLHILADALGSVAVIVSTLLTKYYGWYGWDPIASCIIAILIFLSAIPLVKSSGARLMLSLPNDVEYGIRNALGELGTLRGVIGYAVPKFWLEDEDVEDVRERSQQFLKDRGMDVVVHVEKEGEGRCWCGGAGSEYKMN